MHTGDWWETRGTLPVEPLNAVLDELSTWTEAGLPMLMLVGNHDQVCVGLVPKRADQGMGEKRVACENALGDCLAVSKAS